MTRVALLGATGSIGRQAIEIIAMLGPILPSVRSLVSRPTSPSMYCLEVPSIQKLLGQRLASSGARSVTALKVSCG